MRRSGATARRRRCALLVAVLLLAATACGTRLPASAFTSAPQASAGPSGPAIPIGMIDSITSPLGVNTFSGPGYGAQAFFDALNASGGVNGRKIKVYQCDDGGSGIGNEQCVHQLIDSDHVFA